MRMITKGRFAVTAMMDLALSCANGPVSLHAIALRQGISVSYLDQLFGRLRKSGLVDSVRGPSGGYSLARDAASISVADIVAAVDGPDEAVAAATVEPGARRAECVVDSAREVWHLLNVEMEVFLGAISLKSLVDVQRTRAVPVREARLNRGISSKPVVQPIRTDAPNSVFALAESMQRHTKAS